MKVTIKIILFWTVNLFFHFIFCSCLLLSICLVEYTFYFSFIAFSNKDENASTKKGELSQIATSSLSLDFDK